MIEIVKKLYKTSDLLDDELEMLIKVDDKNISTLLRKYADNVRREYYGNKVFLRGIIAVSSYCKNDCLYCGIRRSNRLAQRYRLSCEDIMKYAKTGYNCGCRTFVMQGGEDDFLTDKFICETIYALKWKYPDCTVTLSIGERTRISYRLMKTAGADRYLLRQETADNDLYRRLHPLDMNLNNRKRCLYDLRDLGYQVGAGFMIGAPFQTIDNLISDLRFMKHLSPHMIGIGPFIPHKYTPFREKKSGTLKLTLRILGIIRLMFPKVLLPATTALGTIVLNGRILGLQTGCNVIMQNILPNNIRKKYNLYNKNLNTDGAAVKENIDLLRKKIVDAGYLVV